MIFNSPTYGSLTLVAVVENMVAFMNAVPSAQYHIVVGADSQVYYKTASPTSASSWDEAEYNKAPEGRLTAYQKTIGREPVVFYNQSVDFVTIIALHRQGQGGRYFWAKQRTRRAKMALRQRIYEEALRSLEVAGELMKILPAALKYEAKTVYDLEIHVDVGPNGQTKAMIQEIVGMIRGNGFTVRTKPEAYGAFVVADKHT